MTAAVRILTIRTVDSSPALLLIDPDGSKTLVNCGEGCQRSFLEHAQKLSTVRRVCLTHLAYDSIGGLPGMILTSADAAKTAQVALLTQGQSSSTTNGSAAAPPQSNGTLELTGLELIGPEGTKSYFRSLRHFMRREDFSVTIREGQHHEAPASSQEEVSKTNRTKKKRKRQEMKQTASTINGNNAPPAEQQPSYFGVQTIPIPYRIPTLPSKMVQVVSYIFTTPPITGKFLPDKAKELGIPPGPLYSRLKGGHNVTFTNTDGQVIHVEASQVVLQSTPGMVIVVLYYPTMDVWKALLPELDQLLQNQTRTAKMELIVHMTTPELFNDPVCISWRENQLHSHSHEDDTRHLFLETSDPAIFAPQRNDIPGPFTSACIGALVRSQICPDIYRTPDFLQQSEDCPPITTTLPKKQSVDSVVRTATPLLEYVLIPRSRKGYAELVSGNYLEERRNDGMQWLSQSGAKSHAQEILKGLPLVVDNDNSNGNDSKAELIMTGTGSAIPCKHRNVTGMCLRMDNGQGIMLDIGEGSVGQLLRASLFISGCDKESGRQQALLLKSIQAAWVSHPHADHHLGLLRLLTDRQSAMRSRDNSVAAGDDVPLLVIAPPPILDFLREYEQIDPRIASSYIPLDCREIVHDPDRPRLSLPSTIKDNPLVMGGGISRLEAIPVSHCPFSFAVVLEGTSFGTVAYSGDCRPSARFAERARNADLLIHEATFEDGMEAEATMKRHSTVGEAIKVAQEMRAKQLVLTHFSQRYPKIPPLVTGSAAGGDIPVIFAFDFMALTPSNLNVASSLTPAMRNLYPEVVEAGPSGQEGAIADAAMSIPGFFAHNPYD
jgi:ribonuclease Z